MHGSQPNKAVTDLILRMPRLDGKYCAAFCTKSLFGDRSTLAAMSRYLDAKGAKYLGGFCAIGWSRFIGNFGPRIFHRGHPSAAELERAREFGAALRAKASQPSLTTT